MGWPLFWIVPSRPFVEFFTICAAGHREVIETLDGVAFDARPAVPSGGFPEACPACFTAMDYEGDRDEGGATGSCMGGHVWLRPETGEEHRHQHEFGAGATYDVTGWTASSWRGPDGRSLAVILPPGGPGDLWLIDGPAGGSDRRPWQRNALTFDEQGSPTNLHELTVTPSILTPRYHSFLTQGALGESLPDRPLPAETPA